MDFSERLKYYREKAGYKTGKEFAKALNMSYPSYMAYENKGREPKYDILMKIAQNLNVTTDDLLGFRQTELSQCISFLRKHDYSIYSIGCDSQGNNIYFIDESGLVDEDNLPTFSETYLNDLNKGDPCCFLTEKEIIHLVNTISTDTTVNSYIGGAIYDYLLELTETKKNIALIKKLQKSNIIPEEDVKKMSEALHDSMTNIRNYVFDDYIYKIIEKLAETHSTDQ